MAAAIFPLPPLSGQDTHVVEQRRLQPGIVQALLHRRPRPLQTLHDLRPIAHAIQAAHQGGGVLCKFLPGFRLFPLVAPLKRLLRCTAFLLELGVQILRCQAVDGAGVFAVGQAGVGVLAHQGVVAVAHPVVAQQRAAHQLLQPPDRLVHLAHALGRLLFHRDGEHGKTGEQLLQEAVLAQGVVGQCQRRLHTAQRTGPQLGPHFADPAAGHQGHEQGQGQGMALQELDEGGDSPQVFRSGDVDVFVNGQGREQLAHRVIGQAAQGHGAPAPHVGVGAAGQQGAAGGGQAAQEMAHVLVALHVLVIVPYQQAVLQAGQ